VASSRDRASTRFRRLSSHYLIHEERKSRIDTWEISRSHAMLNLPRYSCRLRQRERIMKMRAEALLPCETANGILASFSDKPIRLSSQISDYIPQSAASYTEVDG